MVHTFVPTLSLLPPYFPCWTSSVDFLGSVCFQCVVLLSFVCVMVVDFSTLQQWYCYSFCSKGKCHVQNSMSMMEVPHLSYQIGFYFHCVHWPVLCVPALPLGCVYLSHLQHDFLSSCVPSHISTILPSAVMSKIQPLWTHWLNSCPTTPVASLGIYLSRHLFIEQDSPGEAECDDMLCTGQKSCPGPCAQHSHPAFWAKGNSGPWVIVSSGLFWMASV